MSFSRRDFIVGATGAGLGLGLGAFSHQFPLSMPEVGPDWRPGEETFVSSTCLLCPSHCGIRGRLVDGVLSRIDGNPLHPISRGGLCPKGRAGVQMLYHPARVKQPLERVGAPGSGAFQPIGWDAALERVAQAMRQALKDRGGDGIEWLVGSLTGIPRDLVSAFCGAIGSERLYADDYRDGSSEVLRLTQGMERAPAFDLENADYIVSFGAGLAESWWSLPSAAMARAQGSASRARLVQIDSRLSRTAGGADEWVAVAPGTYGTLALGLAYFMLKEGLYDARAISERVSGWEDWTDEAGRKQTGFRRLVLRHGRPDAVSAATGVPVSEISRLAKAFGAAARPVAVWDHAVSWRRGGLSDALAIHALNVMSGRLNRRGGLLLQPDLPLPGPTENGAPMAKPQHACTAWPNADSPADVLLLYRANPVASMPDRGAAEAALAGAGLTVSFSPFLDDSARHADLVLPDHTYLESWQDAFAPAAVAYPVWSIVQPTVAPRFDTRATGDVLIDLAGRLGSSTARIAELGSVEKLVRARMKALSSRTRGSAFVDAFRRNELRELEARGWWIPHDEQESDYGARILQSGGWFDPFYDYHDRSAVSALPGGAVWVFPAAAREMISTAADERPEGFLPVLERAAPDGDYPLTLLPYRVASLNSGATCLMPWMLERIGPLTGESWQVWIEVHPRTAAHHGVVAGERVRVESAAGAFTAVVRTFAGAQPGVVNVPYGLHASLEGWGQFEAANPLHAVGGARDAVTGLPDWYSTRVRLVADRGD